MVAGGHWPAIVDELISQDLAYDAAEREAGLRAQPPGMVLLQDLHKIWSDCEDANGFASTKDLVRNLIWHNPGYWGSDSAYGKPLTDTRLGKLLSQSAKVTSIRLDRDGPRGYRRGQLEPAWTRLRIHPPNEPGALGAPGAPGGDAGHTAHCAACGTPLMAPESIARSLCRECALNAAA